MKYILHRSDTRGHYDFGWLDTRHTFSFARYFDANRIKFGALRVLNDDIVKPNKGFGEHPHDNMEIISIPLKGSLLHKDSTGHEQIIKENEVQVMSAGTGIYHSEYNASETEEVNFLQIWIYPDKQNINPGYDQKFFDPGNAINKWQTLVSNTNEAPLQINQNAQISRSFMKKNETINFQLKEDGFGIYIFLIEGNIEIEGIKLNPRDGIGFTEQQLYTIKAMDNAYILKIDIPVNDFTLNE